MRWFAAVCAMCSICGNSADFFHCFPWFDTVEFNRLLCPNDKMHGDVVFANRFRYPLTMFGICLLIVLSWLLHAHIAYEIDTAKIIAAFCRISHCLYYYMRLNLIACRVKTTDVRCCSFRWSILLYIDNVGESSFVRVISMPSSPYCIKKNCRNHHRILPNFLFLYDYIRLNSITCRVQPTRCTMMWFSLIDCDRNRLCSKFVHW